MDNSVLLSNSFVCVCACAIGMRAAAFLQGRDDGENDA